jgi:pyridoxamine 5'-phosphate oxidase
VVFTIMSDYLTTPSPTEPRIIDQIRDQGMQEGLHRQLLADSPVDQFAAWYSSTITSGLPEPNAMTLATVDGQGQPWTRTVLLKLYDHAGFVFFTNYHSTKAQHLAGNAQVALLFPWVALARQVQILGQAHRLSTAESVRYFVTRPRGSQIGAWASPQSQVISSRALLEAQVAAITERFRHGEVPLPDFWGGYRVIPHYFEFWQGRANRLHDRFCYRRANPQAQWQIERLAP